MARDSVISYLRHGSHIGVPETRNGGQRPAVAIRVSVDYHRSDIAGAENYFTRVLSNADHIATGIRN